MAKRPAPHATRAELDETIAEIKAKAADGWSVQYYWTAEKGTVKKTGEEVWGLHRVPVTRFVNPLAKGNPSEGEQWHINEAADRNRKILRSRHFKITGVTFTGSTTITPKGLE